MASKRWLVVAAGLGGAVVILAVAVGVLQRDARHGPPAERASDVERVAPQADAQRGNAQATRYDPRGDPHALRRADEMRARIHALILRAETDTRSDPRLPPRPSAVVPEAVHGQAERARNQYIEATLRQRFLPIARGCYEELRARNPNASGSIALGITVVGDPSVGGVVESVQLNGNRTSIDDVDMLDCLVQSLMASSFGAPPEGQRRLGMDHVFQFSADASDLVR